MGKSAISNHKSTIEISYPFGPLTGTRGLRRVAPHRGNLAWHGVGALLSSPNMPLTKRHSFCRNGLLHGRGHASSATLDTAPTRPGLRHYHLLHVHAQRARDHLELAEVIGVVDADQELQRAGLVWGDRGVQRVITADCQRADQDDVVAELRPFGQ